MNFKKNLYIKIAAIVIITLLLLIPTTMIKNVIHEREGRQQEAITEVSSKWANAQTISGPFLAVPYYKYVKETSPKDSISRVTKVKDFLYILPSQLNINGQIKPEKRQRSIYEIVVYNSQLTIEGQFTTADLASLEINLQDIEFDKAELVVGIDDLRGIEEQITLMWDEQSWPFNPGVRSKDVVSSGINAHVNITANAQYKFKLALNLKGSQSLYFTPVGKITDINIESEWANPSFNGAFLPDHRIVDANGFKANWNVLHLNRNFPQLWTGNKYSLLDADFGIDLLLPIDNYQKAYRTIQYAILFVAFTFLVFFFIEVLNKRFIHPIQYILVGIALIVFYTLLLSISEHLSFNIAFIVSALATLLLISGYVKAILKSTPLTMLITGILTILYTFIFVIIQLQDYALLIGSIGVFLIVALVMYFSRKIDWYQLTMGEADSGQTPLT